MPLVPFIPGLFDDPASGWPRRRSNASPVAWAAWLEAWEHVSRSPLCVLSSPRELAEACWLTFVAAWNARCKLDGIRD
jgi:hypothetical protein